MPTFESDDKNIYYRTWPVKTPKAVTVVLHGRGEHSDLYHRFASYLNRHDISVWGIDHRGYGHTGGPLEQSYDFEQLAADAVGLMKLAHHDHRDLPMFAVGHSMGGLTLATALQHDIPPLTGIVLSGTPLEWEEGRRAIVMSDGEPTMSLDPVYLDALEFDSLAPVEQLDFAASDRSMIAAIDGLRSAMPGWKIPTLFINGQHDVIAPPENAEKISASLENAVAIRVDHAHHDVINDLCHEEVAVMISDYVLKLVSGRSLKGSF